VLHFRLNMNLAIPLLRNQIAPCFEAAKQFELVVIKNKKIVSKRTVNCLASEGFLRVRMLRLYEINTLICNGIKNFYRDQLLALGISVIPNINLSVEDALSHFLTGKLKSVDGVQTATHSSELVSHEDLVKWAKDLFTSKGYSVSLYSDDESFLIDLVARINCPICNKQVKVAVCCGAQIYSAEQEIKEFHHITKTQFDARVYVYLKNPVLEKSCVDYGIDYLSPEKADIKIEDQNKSIIPILSRPIEGHEKAFRMEV
jgi:predicted Fe-Mo cluster-binding NifX family protein